MAEIKKKAGILAALAGNPNSGKTTIFNNLTGARQHVGNYPGVTIEKKEGLCRHGGHEITMVDLPGIYGLTSHSLDEKVARDFLITEKPDVIVDVIDASNIERSLYLTVQMMELGIPIVLVFNMSDVAGSHGMQFDLDFMRRSLDVPIIMATAHRNIGMQEIMGAVVARSGDLEKSRFNLKYGDDFEAVLEKVKLMLVDEPGIKKKFAGLLSGPVGIRWLAIKLLEKDGEISSCVSSAELEKYLADSQAKLQEKYGDETVNIITDKRYGFIAGICREGVEVTEESRLTLSDRLDSVVTHRYFGMPIFLILMYLLFMLTFRCSEPLMGLLEAAFAWLSAAIAGI